MQHQINEDRDYFGYKMQTRRHYHDDHIMRAFFQEKEQNHYRLPEKMTTVVDVGANIGCVSILCAEKGATVYAFEPAKDNFYTLTHNIVINGYADKVKCFNCAVGKPGIAKLYIHPTNSGATSLFLHTNNGADENDFEEVSVISIKDVFKVNKIEHCDLLKLDCEGAEDDIIADLDDELAAKIDQITVEFHHKRKISENIAKLSKWYNVEKIRRYEYVCLKKPNI